MVLLKTVGFETQAQGRTALEAGAEQNQPQSSGLSCGKPPQSSRDHGCEEITQVMLGCVQLCSSWGKGCTSVFETLELQKQQLAGWAGLVVVPESTAFTPSSLCPLPCKAVPLKL